MISLAEKHPELENEWDDSNEPITPWNVSYGSNKKVRWKGICGHTWEAIIKNRASGHGCPICTIHSYKYALRHIFRIIGIKANIDIERDLEAINGTVLMEGVHDEEFDDENNTTGTWNTALAGNMLPHKQKTRRA